MICSIGPQRHEMLIRTAFTIRKVDLWRCCMLIFQWNESMGMNNLRKQILHHLSLFSQCDVCGAGFSSKYNLQSHYDRVHLQKRTHKCAYCPRKFKVRTSGNAHPALFFAIPDLINDTLLHSSFRGTKALLFTSELIRENAPLHARSVEWHLPITAIWSKFCLRCPWRYEYRTTCIGLYRVCP